MCHIPGSKSFITRKDSSENIIIYLATRVGCEALIAAKTPEEQNAAVA